MVNTSVTFNFLIILIFIAESIPAKAQHRERVLTCEGELVNMKCPEDQYILVKNAFWGRKNKKDCPIPQSSKNTNQTSERKCLDGFDQDFTLWRYQQICDKMNSCTTPATTAFFGFQEVCPNVYKYARVSYKCKRYDINSWLGGDKIYY
jgi:Galactose binding lectin domain.